MKVKTNAKIFRGSSLPKKKPFRPDLKNLLIKAFKIGKIEFDSPLNFTGLSIVDADELVDEIWDIMGKRYIDKKKKEKYFLENCIQGRKVGVRKEQIKQEFRRFIEANKGGSQEIVCKRLVDFYANLGVFKKIGVKEDKYFEGVKVGFSNVGDSVKKSDLGPIKLERYV